MRNINPYSKTTGLSTINVSTINGSFDDAKMWRDWYMERGSHLRSTHIGLPLRGNIIRWGVDAKEYIIIQC